MIRRIKLSEANIHKGSTVSFEIRRTCQRPMIQIISKARCKHRKLLCDRPVVQATTPTRTIGIHTLTAPLEQSSSLKLVKPAMNITRIIWLMRLDSDSTKQLQLEQLELELCVAVSTCQCACYII